MSERESKKECRMTWMSGCRDYDVTVFGGGKKKKKISLLRLLIYIIDIRDKLSK